MNEYRLLMKNPALDERSKDWENATPVGNGRLGAMLYGYVKSEKIQLNEDGIWSGDIMEVDGSGFREKFDAVRELLKQGKNADALAEQTLGSYWKRVRSYETAGELTLAMDNFSDDAYEEYTRVLDMKQGVATVSLKKDGVSYTRTLFASYPDDAIVFHVTADQPGMISLTATYTRETNLRSVTSSGDTMAIMGETVYGAHPYYGKLRFLPCGGTVKALDDGRIQIEKADSLTVIIALKSLAEAVLPSETDYKTLLSRHTADFSAIMSRATIRYESDAALDALPVAERLQRIREGGEDSGLVNLYFQFGRYLLLSSSRGASLPANLQGVWNQDMNAAWGSDYHTNINLQMNYWNAETANIAECALPLFHYMNDLLLPGGQRAASSYYHCRGAVVHHLSDIYQFAYPADGLWGIWPLGGAWLCYSLWEHYLFDPDPVFLKETAYPFISACTRFFLDYMFEDENGLLQTGPSTSPENRYFLTENGEKKAAYLCLSPTMDIEIVSGLLEMYIKTEELLKIDPAMKDEAEKAIEKLPPLKIGRYGQLQEWQEDYDEPEPGHRHISHSFALYPGWQINANTPELMNALRVTLERRLASGGGHTGWSCAWLLNLFARLGDGKGDLAMLHKLFSNSTKDNLFDSHPPFQIDGNFGASAAMAEMLLQSHTDTVVLLPALPADAAYQNGSFEGLRARGGLTLSACWKDGKVTIVTITAKDARPVTLSVNGSETTVSLCAGETRTLTF